MLRILMALVAMMIVVAGCSTDQADTADMVLMNGKVYTMAADEWAEAVAVTDGKITFVGTTADVKALIGDDTEVVDLDGQMLLPGFVSGHDHLVASMWTKSGVDLTSLDSKEAYLAAIKEYADANPEEPFVFGFGWASATYGGYPTAKELDEIVPDRPAMIFDFSIHDLWFNSKALKAGKVDKNTVDPKPGFSYWVRDAQGNPTGVGVEVCWFPAYVEAGAWDPDRLITKSQKMLYDRAAETGITTYVNQGIVTPNISNQEPLMEDYRYSMKLLKDLDDKGELKLRSMINFIIKDKNANIDAAMKFAKGLQSEYNSDMLRLHGVKIHPEGNAITRTAVMSEPFEGSDFTGVYGLEPAVIAEIIQKSNANNLPVSVHVEGDATVTATLDAIESVLNGDHTDARFALQHIAIIQPEDMERVAQMGVGLNYTTLWATDWANSYNSIIAQLGQERVHTKYQQIRTAVDKGIKVNISADVPSSPIEDMGPINLVGAGITRTNPRDPDSKPFPPMSQAITLEQGLRAITIDGAWHANMEDKVGSIEVGKYADFVIMEKNLFDVADEEVAHVPVVATHSER